MKKLSSSVSPFLMMIIPVVLFVGLTVALRETPNQEELSNHNSAVKSTATTIVKVGEESLIRFLLRN